MISNTQMINAWILLDEDEPSNTNYNSPTSCYQMLIQNSVYTSVDLLYLCFATTLPTSATTIPAGDGSSYTIEIGQGSHPGGLTNQDYMNAIIRDARKNNPNIKIGITLNYGDKSIISNIFSNPSVSAESSAASFAANLIAYLKYYDLDGFDIDWESPLCDGTTPQQFAFFIGAIGAEFNAQTDKQYLLTLSPATTTNLDADSINQWVSFVNLQLYSGFTHPQDFINAGISPKLFAYGAKFEAISAGSATTPGYQTALKAYADNAQNYNYAIFTNWRLNSSNYEFEQQQQQQLYQLVSNNGLPPPPDLPIYTLSAAAASVSSPQSTSIYVTNNTGSTASILLMHQFSNGPIEHGFWPKVAAGQAAGPLHVNFSTSAGGDYWQIVVWPEGESTPYFSTGSGTTYWKECTLKSADANQNLYFAVSLDNFLMAEKSGGCENDMGAFREPAQAGVFQNASVVIQNNTGAVVDVLFVFYSAGLNLKVFNLFPNVAAGDSTSPTLIAFIVPFGESYDSDYWTIQAVDRTGMVYLVNDGDFKECGLGFEDDNTQVTLNLSVTSMSLDITSGGCSTSVTKIGSVISVDGA